MAADSELDLAIFLGGIWVAGKSMLEASAFVNDLRDTIVVGKKDGNILSRPHKKVLRNDWVLTMIGAVTFPLMYSGFLVFLAQRLTASLESKVLGSIVFAVASIPALGALLFALCGIGDWSIITVAIRQGPLLEEKEDGGHPSK